MYKQHSVRLSHKNQPAGKIMLLIASNKMELEDNRIELVVLYPSSLASRRVSCIRGKCNEILP